MITLKITEHEQSVLVNALRVAADKFKSNAQILGEKASANGTRLATTFENQAGEAAALANKIECES